MHRNTKTALAKIYGDNIPAKVSKAVDATENALGMLGGGALPAATLAVIIVREDGEPKQERREEKASTMAKVSKKG